MGLSISFKKCKTTSMMMMMSELHCRTFVEVFKGKSKSYLKYFVICFLPKKITHFKKFLKILS